MALFDTCIIAAHRLITTEGDSQDSHYMFKKELAYELCMPIILQRTRIRCLTPTIRQAITATFPSFLFTQVRMINCLIYSDIYFYISFYICLRWTSRLKTDLCKEGVICVHEQETRKSALVAPCVAILYAIIIPALVVTIASNNQCHSLKILEHFW
jgi:hypothetical protein